MDVKQELAYAEQRLTQAKQKLAIILAQADDARVVVYRLEGAVHTLDALTQVTESTDGCCDDKTRADTEPVGHAD